MAVFTFVLCVTLLTLTIVLFEFGSLLMVLPWAFLFEWCFRILGAAALGPHMYWVGKHWRADATARQKENEAFEQADAKSRKAILARHREALLEEAREQMQRDAGGMLDWLQTDALNEAGSRDESRHGQMDGVDGEARTTRMLFDDTHFHTLLVRPQLNAGALRHRFRPDFSRSHAYPSFPSEDRVLERAVAAYTARDSDANDDAKLSA